MGSRAGSSPVKVVGLLVLAVFTGVLAFAALRTNDPSAASGAADVPTPRPSTTIDPSEPSFTPLQPTQGRDKPFVLIVGDSYTGGTGADQPAKTGYVAQLAVDLGWNVRVLTTSGGGYTAEGGAGPVGELVTTAELSADKPDMILLQAGHNDATAGSQTGSAASAVLRSIRDYSLDVPVVMVGLFWPDGPEPETTPDAAASLSAAAKQYVQVLFLDPYTEPWDKFPTVDGIHPTQAGHDQIAEHIEGALRTANLTS